MSTTLGARLHTAPNTFKVLPLSVLSKTLTTWKVTATSLLSTVCALLLAVINLSALSGLLFSLWLEAS